MDDNIVEPDDGDGAGESRVHEFYYTGTEELDEEKIRQMVRRLWEYDRSLSPQKISRVLKDMGIDYPMKSILFSINSHRASLGLVHVDEWGRPKAAARKGKNKEPSLGSPELPGMEGTGGVLEALTLVARAKKLVGKTGLLVLVKVATGEFEEEEPT